MEIIIGMTAINRPELHSNNMGDWYNWINSLDKAKYNINWFINVDYIEKLESSVEDTIENFREIIQENQTYFYKNDAEGGNFLKACKRVSSNIEEFIKKNEFNEEKIAIIWLEDDLYDKIKLAYDDKNNVVGEIEMFDKYYNIIISTDPKNTMEYVKNALKQKPCLHVDGDDLMLFC